jgi:DNA replication protein DnaC
MASTMRCCRRGPPVAGEPAPANRHDELQTLLRSLNLSHTAKGFADLALRASKANWTHEAFLHEVARQECEYRSQRRVARLLHQSGLPGEKTFRTFQLEPLGPTLRLQVERLQSGGFLEEATNVIAVGKPGAGKSHLLAALGHELVGLGHPVYWTSTAALVQQLLAAKRDLRLPQELAKLDRFACVFLDDIGYVQQDRDEMEVLFTFLAERYERRSVAITTNLVFSEWERIFKHPMTTLAAIDRVVHHAVLLDMTAIDSFRAKAAQQAQALPTPPAAPPTP